MSFYKLGTDADWLRQYRFTLTTIKGESAKPIAASFEHVKDSFLRVLVDKGETGGFNNP